MLKTVYLTPPFRQHRTTHQSTRAKLSDLFDELIVGHQRFARMDQLLVTNDTLFIDAAKLE
jgi:hypothetical protein